MEKVRATAGGPSLLQLATSPAAAGLTSPSALRARRLPGKELLAAFAAACAVRRRRGDHPGAARRPRADPDRPEPQVRAGYTTARTYPTATDAEVAAALDAAHAATAWGRGTSVAERAALLRRLGNLHAEHRAKLAAGIVREIGKPLDEAKGEIDFCVDIYHYYADHAEKFLADEELAVTSGPGSAVIRRGPVGVLLGSMPWICPQHSGEAGVGVLAHAGES
ncbi:aldehyde dehydrogenase family protein [Streptomyces longwoodensis]|uniref:aldehyde dehydrogenase family protein n=1 Tax=Streptomyces longwoodensis TaxID=68231 RepID=UPI0022501369|nr:aldehyde dehydrogenase family protein [Streptomyces longwoodensis]MCX5000555.1 aldehyde dehydrogenase family protein [Streptomyces longwoodensis]WUC61946.1 aldehyde dehydrogenase family protein [Streptomyces longwoodensis]